MMRITLTLRSVLFGGCLLRRATMDAAIKMGICIELLMEGLNGLFVAKADLPRQIAWMCELNPMYHVVRTMLRVDDAESDEALNGSAHFPQLIALLVLAHSLLGLVMLRLANASPQT